MSKKVYVLLAEGFEEIEAITPADILRRIGLDVKLVGVTSKTVKGSHGIELTADITLNKASSEIPDALILPGGMPGAKNLESSPLVKRMIQNVSERAGIIGAICAAPYILGKMGLLEGKKATCYPGYENQLIGADFVKCSVVTDQNIVTANGAGAASDFAFELGKHLSGEVESMFVKRGMQYR